MKGASERFCTVAVVRPSREDAPLGKWALFFPAGSANMAEPDRRQTKGDKRSFEHGPCL